MTDLKTMCKYLLTRMSWQELSEHTNINASTISRTRRGVYKNPHKSTIAAFTKLYEREKRKEAKGG